MTSTIDAQTSTACSKPVPVVNSWTEWGPLEEVLVGTLDGAACAPWESGMYASTPRATVDEVRSYHLANGGSSISDKVKISAQRELDEFINILEGEGIVVRRPESIDHSRPITTPLWTSSGGNANANPRDVLAIMGDEILEAPMSWRSRYFEYMGYRDLVMEYFRAGAKWTAAPKPTMSNKSYNWDYELGAEYVTTENEPLFDAADMMRCGRDIFIQRSHVTNDTGIEWLRRTYDGRFNFHRVEFQDERAVHIDATFVALRPGLIMVNPERPVKEFPAILRDTDWDFIDGLPSAGSDEDGFNPAYRWLSMNVLSLDENRVIAEAKEHSLHQLLEANGLEVIPCPFRNNYRFGGSFHCATVDIRRRDHCVELF
jgi:glycine amidinotransferase